VERIARQVADALDDLEGVIPAPGEGTGVEDGSFPAMPTFSAGSAGELSPGVSAAAVPEQDAGDAAQSKVVAAQPEHVAQAQTVSEEQQSFAGDSGQRRTMEPVDEFVTPDEAHHEPPPAVDTMADSGGMEAQTPTPEIDQVTPGPDLRSADTTELERDPYRQAAAATGIEQPEQQWNAAPDHLDHDVTVPDNGQAPADTVEEEAWVDVGSAATTTLLIHGVPRATTALSLKRYLEGLAQVHSVEPREYAEGVLRLQVSSDRPVGLDDLRGWPEAEGLSPVTVSDEFVEVRLGV
jgi:hypothetical protein